MMFKHKIDLGLMKEISVSLNMSEKPDVCDSEVRALASDLMALTVTKDVPSEDEIRNLRERDMFIEADHLSEIEPGDVHNVDAINMSLGAAGFDAGYANIVSLNSITISIFYLDGEELGVMVRQMESMVESWDGSMLKNYVKKGNN